MLCDNEQGVSVHWRQWCLHPPNPMPGSDKRKCSWIILQEKVPLFYFLPVKLQRWVSQAYLSVLIFPSFLDSPLTQCLCDFRAGSTTFLPPGSKLVLLMQTPWNSPEHCSLFWDCCDRSVLYTFLAQSQREGLIKTGKEIAAPNILSGSP